MTGLNKDFERSGRSANRVLCARSCGLLYLLGGKFTIFRKDFKTVSHTAHSQKCVSDSRGAPQRLHVGSSWPCARVQKARWLVEAAAGGEEAQVSPRLGQAVAGAGSEAWAIIADHHKREFVIVHL